MSLNVDRIRTFLERDDGPTAVEYAVMLALIIVVCVSVVGTLGVNTAIICDTVCSVLGKSPNSVSNM